MGKVVYHSLGDAFSLLVCFYGSFKRMWGLWCKEGKFCFLWHAGVLWIEANFHELHVVVENLPSFLLHFLECIVLEIDNRRRMRMPPLSLTIP